jgi:hypothetical protein
VESAIRRRRWYALIHSQRSHLLLTTTYKIKQHSSSSTVETWVALPWNNQWSSSIYSWYYSVKRNIYLFILSKRRKKQCRSMLRKKKTGRNVVSSCIDWPNRQQTGWEKRASTCKKNKPNNHRLRFGGKSLLNGCLFLWLFLLKPPMKNKCLVRNEKWIHVRGSQPFSLLLKNYF